MDSVNQYLNEIRSVLVEEIGALSQTPRESVLSNGKRIAVRGDSAVYRFEIPENFHFIPPSAGRCMV